MPALPGTDTPAPLDLGLIRSRCEAATEGPWYFDPFTSELYGSGHEHGRDFLIAYSATNGDFIAHTRTDLPAALTVIEQMAAALRYARRFLKADDVDTEYIDAALSLIVRDHTGDKS